MKKENQEKQTQQMSQVCAIAHKIYSIWRDKREELQSYFQYELGIPENEARLYAEKYRPEQAPLEICPLAAIKYRKPSHTIFSKLALQFDSGVEGVWPKNILAWWVMRHVFGAELFNFQINEGSRPENRHNHIKFHALPRDSSGKAVALGLAAVEAIDVQGLPAHVLKKAAFMIKELGEKIGIEVAKMFLAADILFPPTKDVVKLVQSLKRGLAGEEVIVAGAFCPDYSYEATGDPVIPFHYTFDGVSDGIGLVAQQFQRVIPCLHEFLNKNGIRHKIMLSIGDFEADSQLILERVQLDQSEFLTRCEGSLKSFAKALPAIPMQLQLFKRDVASGRWTNYVQQARAKMMVGDFGNIRANTGKDPEEEIQYIAKAGRDFYDMWYGKKHTTGELINLVISQGAEYVAVGRILDEDFHDYPIVQIAGDRPKMQIFGSMHARHPTLCTRRIY
ncbi:MAG: hypothetical protein WC823_01190 [Parcubacteria group bacterium]|jgi:hypothetical protein